MGTLYELPLKKPSGEPNAVTIYKNITVGTYNLPFRFQWAVASEEQYNILISYIDTKTKSDPMLIDGVYTYNYNYMEYYLALRDKTEAELNDWLDSDPVLPQSIAAASRASQLIMLKNRIKECTALEPVLAQYEEVIKWQFHVTIEGEVNVGVIEPGGWYRHQDGILSFRFVSALPHIGRNDFDKVTMEFEINNE
jgi:hypothetical protein